MASGGLIDLAFASVGDVDSGYYGVNILDSGTTRLLINEDTTLEKKTTSADDNFLTFPHPLSVHEITGSTNIVIVQQDGGGDGGGGGGDTIVERWY